MLSLKPRAVKQCPQPRSRSRTSWLDLTGNFPDERDCLASFLALEAAEVLAGVKPANLVQLRNRRQPCGRNLYNLWQLHSDSLLADSPLQGLAMRQKENGNLMLFYVPELLRSHLQRPETGAFLSRLGYPAPGNLQATLTELLYRFQTEADMPHEIGIFLGYPLKDVAGFMGCSNKPCTACRQWRIYGDPAPSLALGDCYSACRRDMASRLIEASDPVALLHTIPKPPQTVCVS